MKRRQLFKYLGAVTLAAPFVAPFTALKIAEAATESIAEKSALYGPPRAENGPKTALSEPPVRITVDTRPLVETDVPEPLKLHSIFDVTEPLPDSYRTYYIVPKVMIEQAGRPSKEDPLGNYGFVAVKYLVGGQQYGDWVQFSDPEFMSPDSIEEAKSFLRMYSEEKLRLVDPHARFYTF